MITPVGAVEGVAGDVARDGTTAQRGRKGAHVAVASLGSMARGVVLAETGE